MTTTPTPAPAQLAQHRQTGWTLVVTMIGAALIPIGFDMQDANTFSDLLTPGFIGSTLVSVGAVIGAFYGGRRVERGQSSPPRG